MVLDTASDPSSGFSTTDIYNVGVYGLQHGLALNSNALYLVITPPGIASDNPLEGAYHTYGTVNFHGTQPFNIGWIGTDGTLDQATTYISHEVVEAMTDPRGDAWQVDPRNTVSWNEVADNEAQNYTYRLNGYRVQSYWSPADGAFKVDDGNSQNFYVNNGQLTVNGDQFGYGYNDTIVVDVNAAGGVYLTLNGQVVTFDPGKITSIVVNTGAGSNSVSVNNEAAGVALTINDGGSDSVRIGSYYGGVQGILDPFRSATRRITPTW